MDIHTAIAPNVLLAKAGLYDPNNKAAWKAYFHGSGGAAFLHLKDKNDTKTLEKVKQLLSELPVGQKNFFAVKERAALDEAGADPN